MENLILHNLNELLESNKNLVKEKLSQEILICAIGGSVSLNLHSQVFDIDVYAIVDSVCQKMETAIDQIYMEGYKFDFMCVSFSALKAYAKNYILNINEYPSCFHRNQEESEAISKRKDCERKDFPREMVERIFISDHIIEFAEGAKNDVYHNLRRLMPLAAVWNDYFIRARGNYIEKIKGADAVPLRKYLYTISEMFFCWEIYHNQHVDMDFAALLDNKIFMEKKVNRIVQDLYHQNKSSTLDKTKEYVKNYEILDEWIEKCLQELLILFEKDKEYMANNYLLLK